MKIIFFVIKSSYRNKDLKNIFVRQSKSSQIFISVNGIFALILNPVIYILSKCLKNIKVVYSDYEFIRFKDAYRLWWNSSNENKIRENKPIMMVRPVFAINNETKFLNIFPILAKDNAFKASTSADIVFMSEIDLNFDAKYIDAWNLYKEQLLKDFSLLQSNHFWESNFQNLNEYELNILYIAFNNFIRYQCMKEISVSGLSIRLFGNNWRKYGINSDPSNYSEYFSESLYKNNICLDLGSKVGINAMYPRTRSIIESGGILVQKECYDSNYVYGEELKRNISFKNINEMIKLLKLTQKNQSYRQGILDKTYHRFSKNLNIDYKIKNSIESINF